MKNEGLFDCISDDIPEIDEEELKTLRELGIVPPGSNRPAVQNPMGKQKKEKKKIKLFGKK